jgi:hypothetical protein
VKFAERSTPNKKRISEKRTGTTVSYGHFKRRAPPRSRLPAEEARLTRPERTPREDCQRQARRKSRMPQHAGQSEPAPPQNRAAFLRGPARKKEKRGHRPPNLSRRRLRLHPLQPSEQFPLQLRNAASARDNLYSCSGERCNLAANYSYRNATTGSARIARRAGM